MSGNEEIVKKSVRDTETETLRLKIKRYLELDNVSILAGAGTSFHLGAPLIRTVPDDLSKRCGWAIDQCFGKGAKPSVVDCFSTDDTKSIVESFATSLQLEYEAPTINIVEHEWPGLQSVQFNWALDNLPIEAKWILRLDADEYLTPESVEWIKANLDGIDDKVSALEFTLER